MALRLLRVVWVGQDRLGAGSRGVWPGPGCAAPPTTCESAKVLEQQFQGTCVCVWGELWLPPAALPPALLWAGE